MKKYKIRLDICTLCNLDCTACGMRKLQTPPNGLGYLTFENFKRFIDRDGDKIEYIEISNFGEPLLNPDFPKIAKYAYEHNILLDCANGTNLNIRNDETLKALVDYQVQTITVSCDGVTQNTYLDYRRKGDINLVFDNIQKIIKYKKERNSVLPLVNWQYIIRNKSEDEVDLAVEKAKELEVNNLFFKLTWEKDYVPKNPEWLKQVTGLESVTRNEFSKNNKVDYSTKCFHLWQIPAINWDGRLLGCCRNKWPYNVNVFEVGLEEALNYPQFVESKDWIQQKREDLPKSNPCTHCNVYKNNLTRSVNDNLSELVLHPLNITKVEEDNRITLFGLSLNNYFDRPLQKMCVESWYEWKKHNQQIKEIIIYNEDSVEYKEFLKIIETEKINKQDKLKTLQLADAFRMYILSKYPNHLWLDGDVYINDYNLKWNLKFYFYDSWHILFNGHNLQFFKNVFNLYLTEDIYNLIDYDICLKYNLELSEKLDLKTFKCLCHLCQLDNNIEKLYLIKSNKNNIDVQLKIGKIIMDVKEYVVKADKETKPFYHKLKGILFYLLANSLFFSTNIDDNCSIYYNEELYNKLLKLQGTHETLIYEIFENIDIEKIKEINDNYKKVYLIRDLLNYIPLKDENLFNFITKYREVFTDLFDSYNLNINECLNNKKIPIDTNTINEYICNYLTQNLSKETLNGMTTIEDNNTFTIFSLDLNKYFDTPLHKMCVESWYTWKATNNQVKDIIIFNEQSPEYKEFLEIYNTRKYKEFNSYTRTADAFRMYILSTRENYLWLDGDIYIENIGFKWTYDFYFHPCWCHLFNGHNLDYYKKVFNLFITDNLKDWIDADICARYNLPNINRDDINEFIHLCWIEQEHLTPYIIKQSYKISDTISRLWFLRHKLHDEIETDSIKSFIRNAIT